MREKLKNSAISLLKDLISIKSFSSEEDHTASRIEKWFNDNHIKCSRQNNNVYAVNKNFHKNKPTLLLNSHHDTVFPNKAYTKDPFNPVIENGKLFGLGSNDAGGSLVSLMSLFTFFYNHQNLKYNIIIAATAEEESSGNLGLNSLLDVLPEIDLAIVGEPTEMHLAVAEKGLIVIDAKIKGTPSHAAHQNKNSAIDKIPEILNWFNKFKFEKISKILGPVKLTITQINAGKQHNVVPSEVEIVIDIRVNDCYTNNEILNLLKKNAPCEIKARSLDLNSSSISIDHEIVMAGKNLGRKIYGSPTLSDQAKLNCPSIKLGPGDSTRSHTANEYILIKEIEDGIDLYIDLLNKIL